MAKRIMILGAGDAGTATALRLYRAGFKPFIVEENIPRDLYHRRNFCQAMFSGHKTVNGLTARTLPGAIERGDVPSDISLKEFLKLQAANREIPLITFDDLPQLKNEPIDVVFVAQNTLWPQAAPFIADETVRIGLHSLEDADSINFRIADHPPYLGQVLYPFEEYYYLTSPLPATEKPAKYAVKAPLEGVFTATKNPDEAVLEKEEIGRINEIPILAPVHGKISGILNSGLIVPQGAVFAEIDLHPKALPAAVIPEKYFNIAGGVLEAILYHLHL